VSTRRPRRHPERVARTARRDLLLGAGLVAVVGVLAWLSTTAINGFPWSSAYTVRITLPAGAPLLHAGDDVRIGGERAGRVASITLAARGTQAQATLELGGARVGPGASARVRPSGLAGTVYVALAPGNQARPWPSGALISGPSTSVGVQLTDVISAFDASARLALRRTLTGFGAGLSGRGVALNSTITAAPPLLENLAAVLRAARPQPGTLASAVGSADTLFDAVAPPRDQTIASLVNVASSVLAQTGDDAVPIASTIDAAPGVEQQADSVLPSANVLLTRLTTAAQALAPGVQALGQALPGLSMLEARAGAIGELAGVATRSSPVLRALAPVLADLRGPAAGLTPLTDPIDALAQALTPYGSELVQAPLGFSQWGGSSYDFGQAPGHRAVRFTMVLTCALARDPYPAPGQAAKDRKACQ
jgi:ABC-type transporter Mla subunit MlaD